MITQDTSQPGASAILEREPRTLQPHLDQNNAMVAEAVRRGNERVLARFFPNEVDRALRRNELELVKTGFEYRKRLLRMAVETKLQAVEELCNQVLVTGKAEIRRQRQEFFAEQKIKLQESMNGYSERFHADIERRFTALDGYRNEHIRTREEQRLLRALDEFHEMLEQLGADFLAIIREGVSSRA